VPNLPSIAEPYGIPDSAASLEGESPRKRDITSGDPEEQTAVTSDSVPSFRQILSGLKNGGAPPRR
jgi:hypothetical protein